MAGIIYKNRASILQEAQGLGLQRPLFLKDK